MLEEGSILCSYCGKKIEFKTCPHCDTKLEDDSVFCSNCGLRLQDVPEEAPTHDTEIQEIGNTPKKSYSVWYVTSCVGIVLLLLGGFYAYWYFKRISENESSTPVTNVVDSNKKLSLVGDADGYPLILDLTINNSNVTGTYKNVKYGTTMTVTGTLVDNVFNLNGEADNTNYTFQIVAEGENYTGTFGRVGGKKMKLHLKTFLNNTTQKESDLLTNNNIDIYNAYRKAIDDIYYYQDFEKDEDGELIYGWIDYFLYDITGDGIPEIWITYGESEVAHLLRVCTYDKENKYKILHEGSADHSAFYEGKGYIIKMWATMGEASWTKYTFNGKKIVETTIYEEYVGEEDDEGNLLYYRDYKTPTEDYIELHSFQDIEPINNALGLE